MEKIHINNKNPEAYINAILRPHRPKDKFISGRVYLDNGCPIQNACIKITDRHYNPLEHTITDNFGNYNLIYPPNGYYCIFAKENFKTQVISIEEIPNIVILKEEDLNSIVIGTAVINNKHNPVSHIVAEIKNKENKEFSQTVSANEKGEFVFSNVTHGNYTLTLRGNNICTYHHNFFVPNLIKIVSLGVIYVEFIPINGTLNGIITNEDGTPLIGVTVVLYKENFPIGSTKTIENGLYFFGNLQEGTYSIQAFD